MARICPRCGGGMEYEDVMNSLSRYYDVYICSKCGTNEAMRDYYKMGPVPPYQWYANPLMLMEMNDGVLYDTDFDASGYIIPRNPKYRVDRR